MKLGFQSAILDGLSFEEVIKFAADGNFECVEIMCWPPGKAERKYAGVTHLDVTDFSEKDAQRINAFCRSKNITISSLGYYPNPLSPDDEEATIAVNHIKKVIDASALLDINLVTTFVGNDWNKSVADNWPIFVATWGPLLEYAEHRKVKIAIENCAMYFSDDEWPAGKNLAYSPAIWRKMFSTFKSNFFGLNYDPSHLVWMQMNPLKPLIEFEDKIFHAHAKDVKVDYQRLDDVGTMANPLDYHTPKIPGRGDIDWQEYLQALKASGFNGSLCIEVEDSDYESSLADRKRSLIESAKHLRQFL